MRFDEHTKVLASLANWSTKHTTIHLSIMKHVEFHSISFGS